MKSISQSSCRSPHEPVHASLELTHSACAGEGRALLYEPAYEEARQPEHAAGEGSAPMRQQAPYLEGATPASI
jgi:hypothetical protein